MRKEITLKNTVAYHSYPHDGKKHPGLILIEEIWGVNDHIKSVADRLADEGFSVLAPELLPRDMLQKLTPQIQIDLFDPEKRNEVQPLLRAAMTPMMQPEYAKDTIATLKTCVDYLLADAGVNGKVGVIGFCFGGSYSFHLATHDPRIEAAVPFYGQPPSTEEVPNITCPVLAFYGDEDATLIQSLPQLREGMKSNHKKFEAVVYPKAGHAFFNDTNVRQYRVGAARDAWKRALVFLKNNLSK